MFIQLTTIVAVISLSPAAFDARQMKVDASSAPMFSITSCRRPSSLSWRCWRHNQPQQPIIIIIIIVIINVNLHSTLYITIHKMPCYRREDRAIARFLCHSTAFLYRPTSATVQMLKLHKVRWFSRQWREITAIAENHCTLPVKATMDDRYYRRYR